MGSFLCGVGGSRIGFGVGGRLTSGVGVVTVGLGAGLASGVFMGGEGEQEIAVSMQPSAKIRSVITRGRGYRFAVASRVWKCGGSHSLSTMVISISLKPAFFIIL